MRAREHRSPSSLTDMLKVTLKGLLAHKIRFVLTTFAVVIGVGFVVGTIVLTDSVRSQFNQLFVDINKGIDLQVRGVDQFDQGAFGQTPPIPDSLLAQVEAVPGVKAVGGNAGGIKALVIGSDGKPIEPVGGPPLSVSWAPNSPNSSLIVLDGGPPTTGQQVGLDVDTAEKAEKVVGDTVTIITPIGPQDYEISGIFKFGESNSLSGATLAAFTLAEAQRINNLVGKLQTIDVSVEDSSSVDEVQQEITAILPAGVEVVPASTVVSDSQAGLSPIIDTFGNVLLGFAGVTLFVSAFLISNTFTIVVGQRVRELALLRAIGASPTQIAGSVLGEALIVGILASILGFGIGILIALGLNAVLSATGFGTSGTSLVISPSAFVAAFVVGIVVTMLSAISPAWKSTTVPPVAAMRDGFTFKGLSMRTRFIGGTTMALLGAVAIAWALFTGPDTVPLLTGMIGGALLVFLGVALLSPSVAAPIAHLIGFLYRPFRTSGHLAEENAARNPRRTASTASALMIGLALVTTVLVVGTSLKATFQDTIDKTITADWYVVPKSFVGFDPAITQALTDLPELAAVAAVRQGQVQVDGSTKQVSAVDFGEVAKVFNLGIDEAAVGPDTRGVIVNQEPADDLGLEVGSTVTMLFNDTGPQPVQVVAIVDETSFLGNWIVDMATFSANTSVQLDQTTAARTADGVSEADARAAIEPVLAAYPDVRLQDRAEFTKAQLGQIDSLLAVVNVFLALAIIIAVIGITNTLALSVFERTRELGLLRAVGMSRRQLRRMVRLEAVIVAVFGAILGLVVGLLFGFAVSSALPDNFVSGISVPVGTLLFLVVLAALVGVLAAIGPARRASKLDILDAVAQT
jgi:putative ABC transport system permease protein